MSKDHKNRGAQKVYLKRGAHRISAFFRLLTRGWRAEDYRVGRQPRRAPQTIVSNLQTHIKSTLEHLSEVGNVFTAEGEEALILGRGWFSLEDDVLVADNGHQVLTTQQRELWLVQ